MKVVIVGNGAVGSALLAMFRQAGITTALLGRQGIDRGTKTVDFGNVSSEVCSEAMDLTQADTWIFAVKAYDLKEALRVQKKWIANSALVAVICNGYVYDTVIAEYAQVETLRLGSFTFGVKEFAPSHYAVVNYQGTLVWGPLRLGIEATAYENDLQKKLPFFKFVSDPFPIVRQKWLANVAINSLCAYFNLATNGALLQREADVRLAVDEAYRLGEQLWGGWTQNVSYYQEYVQKLIVLTSSNENSMARDVRLGRKTEAEFLVGLVKGYDHFLFLQKLRQAKPRINLS